MIQIIAGEKGSGKTKKLINFVNDTAVSGKGIDVVLATTDRYRQEIKPEVRFIDVTEEGVNNFDRLIGFIKGLLCGNYDIEYVFIDGVHKMLATEIGSSIMADFFMALDSIGEKSMVKFVLTVSCAVEKLPEFVKKYL
ncbi:MAG: hypothetical protein J5781_07720 [Clostridia bacterium]|nr:hypothetical protein [Clostridia bacterium]